MMTVARPPYRYDVWMWQTDRQKDTSRQQCARYCV